MNFQDKVLKLTSMIPRGKITTYGEIARVLSTAPQAVGQALKNNPNPIVIPCHRVVKSDGTIGGFSMDGGIQKKIELLEKEGIRVVNNRIINFEKVLFKYVVNDR